jgi:hypothetical protein
MHGALFDPYPPAFIPHEVDMVRVQEQVAADGVSAPAGVDRSALEQVVTAAGNDGIELKIVVIEDNPPIDTPLRDIANEVGQQHPGATVLVLSPSFAGTYSPSYDRATLEAGEDLAKTGNPGAVGGEFRQPAQYPHFPVDRVDRCIAGRRCARGGPGAGCRGPGPSARRPRKCLRRRGITRRRTVSDAIAEIRQGHGEVTFFKSQTCNLLREFL